jgi:hypothetical protein
MRVRGNFSRWNAATVVEMGEVGDALKTAIHVGQQQQAGVPRFFAC